MNTFLGALIYAMNIWYYVYILYLFYLFNITSSQIVFNNQTGVNRVYIWRQNVVVAFNRINSDRLNLQILCYTYIRALKKKKK